MAPKKGKPKEKGKGKDKNIQEINPEWIGKSMDELNDIVAQLENDLNASRKIRNMAQVEHGSIQSYYDVTREHIRELDMRIEHTDLEIENTDEDNTVELRVYEQKSNFIKYCHDNKLQEKKNAGESRLEAITVSHEKQVSDLEQAKTEKRRKLDKIEESNAAEIRSLRGNDQAELTMIKQGLEKDMNELQEKCKLEQIDLKQLLDTRRTEELELISSRKNAHIADLMMAHQNTCNEIKTHFEGVDREQQIDIEEVQANIRKLKKNAIQHSCNSVDLNKENIEGGKELDFCLEKVATLKAKTKDKTKDSFSLRNTKLRLSSTRKAINDAKKRLASLEGNFDEVEFERNSLRDSIQNATLDASKVNEKKKEKLHDKLIAQRDFNITIERHLQHILHSSGLEEKRSSVLLENLNKYLLENHKDAENINIAIADAKKKYNNELKSNKEELLKRNVPVDKVDTINVLANDSSTVEEQVSRD